MAATAAEQQADNPIDSFIAEANANQWNAIALMLWKDRHRNPSFTIEITERDIAAFSKCIDYLEVEPKLRIFRPGAVPAKDAVPAAGERPAIPARAAIPGRAVAVIQMTDKDGNAIVPIEDNEEDLKKGQAAQRLNIIKTTAPQLAAQLVADVQSQTLSTATILEAADALRVLALA